MKFLKKLFHIHRCKTASDETGCWGECVVCGKRFGFVSRELLRRACDRDFQLAINQASAEEKK